MDKAIELENRAKEILKNRFNEEEIGITQLAVREHELNLIKDEAFALMEESKKNISDLVSKNDMDMTQYASLLAENGEIAKKMDELTDKIYDEIASLVRLRNSKTDLYYLLGNEVKDYNENISDNNSRLSEIEDEINNYTKLKNNTNEQSTINFCDLRIDELKREKKRLKSQTTKYNKKIKADEEQRTFLLNGGKSPYKEEVKEQIKEEEKVDDEVLNNDEDKLTEEEVTPTLTSKENKAVDQEEDKDIIGVIPPIVKEEDELPEKIEDENNTEDKDKIIGVVPPITTEEPTNGELPEEIVDEVEKDDGKEVIPVVLPPLNPDGTLPIGDLPGEIVDEDGIFTEDDDEEDKDKVVPIIPVESEVEKVTQSGPKLWKKIVNVVGMASALLATVGTAIHTGLLLNRIGDKLEKEAQVQENEEEQEEIKTEEENKEEKVPEQKQEQKQEEKVPEQKQEQKQEEKVPEQKQEQKQEEEKAPEQKPEQKQEEEKAPEQKPEQKQENFEILLDSAESAAIDEGKINKNGSLENGKTTEITSENFVYEHTVKNGEIVDTELVGKLDKEGNVTKEGYTVITNEDFEAPKIDAQLPPSPNTPVVGQNEENAISAEEFEKTANENEKAALNDALDSINFGDFDWEKVLQP